MNFNQLGLKKLICTCYDGSPISYTELKNSLILSPKQRKPYKIEITEVKDMNNDGTVDLLDIELLLKNENNNLTILDGDGDFRSEESIEFLKEADIVVTIIWINNQYVFNVSIVSIALNRLFANHQENI